MRGPTAPDWLREAFVLAYADVEEEVGRPMTGKQVNDGYCRFFARRVLERVGEDAEKLTIWSDGYTHTWIEYDGAYYDAQRTEIGALELRHLPMYKPPNGKEVDWDTIGRGFPSSTGGRVEARSKPLDVA